jgi:hypothetical protein
MIARETVMMYFEVLTRKSIVVPESQDFLEDALPYFTGEKPVPVPTYFIGCFGAAANTAIQALADAAEPGGMRPFTQRVAVYKPILFFGGRLLSKAQQSRLVLKICDVCRHPLAG